MLTDDEKRELIANARRQLKADDLERNRYGESNAYSRGIGYQLVARLADALEGTLTEPEWRGVVLGRENGTDEDANWQLTVWDPTEIETARREFPKSEYKLARMILDENGVPDV